MKCILHKMTEAATGLKVDGTQSSSGTPKVPVTSLIFAAASPLALDADPCRRKWRTIRPFHVPLSFDFGDSMASVDTHINLHHDHVLVHYVLLGLSQSQIHNLWNSQAVQLQLFHDCYVQDSRLKVWLSSLTVMCRTCNPEVTQRCRFDSAPGHCRVTTLGKLFTHMCLCHQAV